MSWLASFALVILHLVYRLVTITGRLLRHTDEPQPLTAQRSKLPAHLALTLVAGRGGDNEATEDLMAESVERAVLWCRTTGISTLTVYDREGTLGTLSLDIRNRLLRRFATSSTESDTETDVDFPLTPPSSDDSDSRPISPNNDLVPRKLNVVTLQFPQHIRRSKRRPGVKTSAKRRRTSHDKSASSSFTLRIASRQSGMPVIAGAATFLLRKQAKSSSQVQRDSDDYSHGPLEAQLNSILEGKDGLPAPDLMVVHHIFSDEANQPLELHGFPPWQIGLTEFDCQKDPKGFGRPKKYPGRDDRWDGKPLEEVEFRQALDVYAAAEMRLGR